MTVQMANPEDMIRPCQHEALRRMNHDQWPPGDPLDMDPPAWAILAVLVILAVPLVISAGVSLVYERLWR